MKKTIMVTGAAGFIGTNLCIELLNQGHAVIGVDDLSTGQQKNIDLLCKYPNFQFKKIDITSIKFNKDNFYYDKLEEIYHLASPASPPKYQKDPIKTMLIGVVGTKNVLDIAHFFNSKVLFTSTSEVYGDPEFSPQPESYKGCVNTVGPRACYDESKRAAEALMFDYKRTKGTQIRVARLFNFFGEFMDIDDGRVVTNFIKQSIKNNPLTIYGDGTQTRSFGYVKDCVSGLISLMESHYSDTPVNIGNNEEIPVIQLAKEIIHLTNSKSVLEFKKLPEDDPKQRRPDLTLAKNILNWRPSFSRKEGLINTIKYFNNQNE